MLAIYVSMNKSYFIVIAIICLSNPLFLIADSCKLLAWFFVVIDIDTRVADFFMLLNVIDQDTILLVRSIKVIGK